MPKSIVSSRAAFTPGPGLAAYSASKAGNEQFANVLRIELARRGVDVGTAHMSWIDTKLVREAKADLPTAREMIDALPGPMSKTITVDECVRAFVAGLEQRKRRVNVPRWVGLIGWPRQSSPPRSVTAA